ncbi:hypothetical protein CYMTET_54081 [Cymbomonas tetramitiformis]|uniref:Uncharacterized protein n=1 Tax=Cymbomonas tetramitiformis TaxID=36881 RepID=A0AAE0BHH2_9CHLO|nr:hypothetical protein CYMTET_54081 [Cymbomonas tetramitiformis]
MNSEKHTFRASTIVVPLDLPLWVSNTDYTSVSVLPLAWDTILMTSCLQACNRICLPFRGTGGFLTANLPSQTWNRFTAPSNRPVVISHSVTGLPGAPGDVHFITFHVPHVLLGSDQEDHHAVFTTEQMPAARSVTNHTSTELRSPPMPGGSPTGVVSLHTT